MADGTIQLPPDSTGKILDTTSLTVGLNTVQRERMNIADPTSATALAAVENAAPGASDFGLVVRVAGTPNVTSAASTLAESTAAWTNATAGNTAVTVLTGGFSTVIVTLNQTTTITGGVVTFEASDTTGFTNAFLISGTQNTNGVNAATYTLVASTNQSYAFNVSGFAAFRVRLSTVITGTGTVNVGVAASAAPLVPYTVVNGPVNVRSNSAGSVIGDNLTNVNLFGSSSNSLNGLLVSPALYGGAFSGAADAVRQAWSKQRTPTVFKSVSVAATATGNSAVWTPGTGNKFRLLGYQITAQGLAATATAAITVSFQDSAAGINIGTYDVDVPAVANVVTGVNQISGGVCNIGGFGVLSAAANNVLNFNISAAGAGTVGTYRVTAFGVEE